MTGSVDQAPAFAGGKAGAIFLIHLVDDDEAVRTTLARMLVLSGYPVREYSSGAELLAAAEGLSGCILLDLNMPDANGIAVNKALKELSIDIPVILMTGAGDLGNLPTRPDVGAILQKPFRRTDLMSLLGKFGIRPNAEAKRP